MSADAVKLASMFAAWKESGSTKKFQEIVVANKGLAALEAKKQMRRAKQHGWDEGDVMGAAYEGLCKAVLGFDVGRGTAFSTYACNIIRAAIQSALGTKRIIRAQDAMDAAMVGNEDEGDFTREDTLASDWPGQIEILSTNLNPHRVDLMALAGDFAKLLQGRERDIFETKVQYSFREITPEMLECNNAARVSQIKKDLTARFRAFVEARDPHAAEGVSLFDSEIR